jgi:hypothetical protein
MHVEIGAERRHQLLRPQDFQQRMRFGQETARRPREAAEGTDIMIAGVFGSKPNEILLSFREGLRRRMRSLQWHGRLTSISKALAKPACEPRLGAHLSEIMLHE